MGASRIASLPLQVLHEISLQCEINTIPLKISPRRMRFSEIAEQCRKVSADQRLQTLRVLYRTHFTVLDDSSKEYRKKGESCLCIQEINFVPGQAAVPSYCT